MSRPPSRGRLALRQIVSVAFVTLAVLTPARSIAANPPAPQPSIRTSAPPGFENLLKPQKISVDLLFDGQIAGQALILYTSGRLRFVNPRRVLSLLSGIRDRQQVLKALSSEMPANEGRACARGANPGTRRADCGALRPPVAGVIYDPSRLQVSVFVGEALRDPRAATRARFLTPDNWTPSALHSGNFAVSGGRGQKTYMAYNALTFVNLGAGRLRTDFVFSSDEAVTMNAVAVEVDQRENRLEAGFFRTLGSPLLVEQPLYGARWSTPSDTRIDKASAFGSALLVFLDRPAYVDILKDGRLVSSRFYQPGSRFLDTSGLPGGSYPVTIRIREVGGSTRELQRFYTRSTRLPPKDQPFFLVEAGVLGDRRSAGIPSPSSVPFARAQATVRAWPGTAFGLGVVGLDDDAGLEGLAIWITPYFDLSADVLATLKGDFGVSLFASGRYKRLNYSFGYRYATGRRDLPPDRDDPNNARLLGSRGWQVTGRVAYEFDRLRLGFNVSGQQLSGLTYGPHFRWQIRRTQDYELTLRGEVQRSRGEVRGFALLTFRWSRQNRSLVAQTGVRMAARRGRKPTADPTALLDGNYLMPDVAGYEVTLNPSAQYDDRASARFGSTVRGPLGRFDANASQTLTGGTNSTLFSVNAATNIGATPRGIALGGRERGGAAVHVRLVGPRSGARFRVRINGADGTILSAGESVLLPVSPYARYAVSLRQIGEKSALLDFDSSPRYVSAFPGTVRTLVWRIARIAVVYGRLVDAAGRPLANAAIRGAVGPADTDADGRFQFEAGANRILSVTHRGGTCTATLPPLAGGTNLHRLDRLTCR